MKFTLTMMVQDAIEFLENEQAEYTLSADKKQITVECESLQDVFDLGYGMAKVKHCEKPEEIELPTKFIPLLQQAIKEFSEDTRFRVTSFSFTEKGNMTIIRVQPTQGWILFSIYMRYGRLCEKQVQSEFKS